MRFSEVTTTVLVQSITAPLEQGKLWYTECHGSTSQFPRRLLANLL